MNHSGTSSQKRACCGEVFRNGREARVIVENWRQEYNNYRPHSSLGYLTPVEFARRYYEKESRERGYTAKASGRKSLIVGGTKNGSTPVGVKTLFIEPGSPWENGYVESFNSKLRNELLNGEVFTTLIEARVLIEQWRKGYNHIRPHSLLGYRPPVPEARLSVALT